MNKYKIAKAKEILERAERIPYNPKWTLLEQNQLHAAKDLAKAVLEKRREEERKKKEKIKREKQGAGGR